MGGKKQEARLQQIAHLEEELSVAKTDLDNTIADLDAVRERVADAQQQAAEDQVKVDQELQTIHDQLHQMQEKDIAAKQALHEKHFEEVERLENENQAILEKLEQELEAVETEINDVQMDIDQVLQDRDEAVFECEMQLHDQEQQLTNSEVMMQ